MIDLAGASEEKEITVGPHLSHPEGIAIDPKADRAYVAVTHQDLIARDRHEDDRGGAHAVGRAPAGHRHGAGGRVSVTARRLPADRAPTPARTRWRSSRCRRAGPRRSSRPARARRRASSSTRAGAASSRRRSSARRRPRSTARRPRRRPRRRRRRGPVQRKPKAWELVGRVPVGSYPSGARRDAAQAQARLGGGQGRRVGPEPPERGRDRAATTRLDDRRLTGSTASSTCPSYTFGRVRRAQVPDRRGACASSRRGPRGRSARSTGRSRRRHADQPPGHGGKIKHVFYIVRENRTYDQVLGDDPRGDGDPKLDALRRGRSRPTPTRWRERFPLLDHVYANSEASIDGHFWTSAAAVSDYVVEELAPELRRARRPVRLRRLLGHLAVAAASCSTRRRSRASRASTTARRSPATVPLPDKDRTPEETQEVVAKSASPTSARRRILARRRHRRLLPERRLVGRRRRGALGPGPDVEVYDSSLPGRARRPTTSQSRFDCFRRRFEQQVADGHRARVQLHHARQRPHRRHHARAGARRTR